MAVLTSAAVLAACSAAHDWRQVRPEGDGLELLFPCKPDRVTRQVALAGAPVAMAMHACSAGGQTWAVAVAPLGDPARVTPALEELRRSAAANLGAGDGEAMALAVPGATPNPASRRERLQGRRPDGQPAVEQLAVFARGTTVYQATALGATLPAEAAETFFSSLRFGP